MPLKRGNRSPQALEIHLEALRTKTAELESWLSANQAQAAIDPDKIVVPVDRVRSRWF